MNSWRTGLPSARTFFKDFSSASSNSEESDSLLLRVLGGLRGPDPATLLKPIASEVYRIARGEVARGVSSGGMEPEMTRTGKREEKLVSCIMMIFDDISEDLEKKTSLIQDYLLNSFWHHVRIVQLLSR